MGLITYCTACGQDFRETDFHICPGCERPPANCDCQQTLFYRRTVAMEEIEKHFKEVVKRLEDR
jgi:hypothetical protein